MRPVGDDPQTTGPRHDGAGAAFAFVVVHGQIRVDEIDRYYLYHLFFNQIPPEKAALLITDQRPMVLDKYRFGDLDDSRIFTDVNNVLIALKPETVAELEYPLIVKETITSFDGETLFYLLDTSDQEYVKKY